MERKKQGMGAVRELGSGFWYFCVLAAVMFATFQPYNANLNMLLRSRFGFDQVTAGQLIVSSIKYDPLGLPLSDHQPFVPPGRPTL